VGKEKYSKENFDTLLAKLQHSVSFTTCNSEPTTFDLTVTDGFQKNSRNNVRVMSLESPVKAEGGEAYEGGDENENENENENSPSIKKELSNIYTQLDVPVASKESYDPTDNDQATNEFEDQSDRYSRKSADTNNSEHVSDPGIGKTDFFASPKLKRSCSNLESRDVRMQINEYLSPLQAQSFEDFQDLSINPMVNLKRSRSMTSHCSADRVMLKRHSSSQVLPSGSKKLWWKLFLWSHRNIYRTFPRKLKLVPAINSLSNQLGYSSDTLEPKQIEALRHVQSSVSNTTHSPNKSINDDDQRWSRFQNQWFAFSTETSSYARVDAWVKDLEIQEPAPEDDPLDEIAGSISFPPSPDAGRSKIISTSQLTHSNSNLPKDILLANSMVQSLNPASSVAHISGVGIKAIPVISHFSNLRSVNLSNNFIGITSQVEYNLALVQHKLTTNLTQFIDSLSLLLFCSYNLTRMSTKECSNT